MFWGTSTKISIKLKKVILCIHTFYSSKHEYKLWPDSQLGQNDTSLEKMMLSAKLQEK